MDLESNRDKFSEDSSTITSHVTEVSTEYVSINTSGQYQSLKALLLCNSESCDCAHANGKNCSCSCKQKRDARRVVVNDKVNDYRRNPIRKDFRHTASHVNSDHGVANSSKHYPSKSLGTQNGTVSKTEPKKVSVFTKNSNVNRFTQNNHESKVTFGRSSSENCTNVNDNTDNEDNISEVNQRNYVEKTTYCRPVVSLCNQDYINQAKERNNKLQCLVKKIVEAREREKQNEAWNNYINELKNKHGYYNHEPVQTPNRYITERHVAYDDYYYTRGCNTSGTRINLLDDLFEAHSTSHSTYNPRVPEDRSVRTAQYKPHVFENHPVCYPTSSEAQIELLHRNRIRKGQNGEMEVLGRRGLAYTHRDQSSQSSRKRKKNEEWTHLESKMTQTSDTLEFKSENNVDNNKSESTENDEHVLKSPSDTRHENDLTQDKKMSKTIIVPVKTKNKGKINQVAKTRNKGNTGLKEKLESNGQTSSAILLKEESTREKYERVSESVAKLREHLERSRSTNKESSLADIEAKLDSLINTMNALLTEVHANITTKPGTCDMGTCISKNPSAFDAAAEKKAQPTNASADDYKCDMGTCISKNPSTFHTGAENKAQRDEDYKCTIDSCISTIMEENIPTKNASNINFVSCCTEDSNATKSKTNKINILKSSKYLLETCPGKKSEPNPRLSSVRIKGLSSTSDIYNYSDKKSQINATSLTEYPFKNLTSNAKISVGTNNSEQSGFNNVQQTSKINQYGLAGLSATEVRNAQQSSTTSQGSGLAGQYVTEVSNGQQMSKIHQGVNAAQSAAGLRNAQQSSMINQGSGLEGQPVTEVSNEQQASKTHQGVNAAQSAAGFRNAQQSSMVNQGSGFEGQPVTEISNVQQASKIHQGVNAAQSAAGLRNAQQSSMINQASGLANQSSIGISSVQQTSKINQGVNAAQSAAGLRNVQQSSMTNQGSGLAGQSSIGISNVQQTSKLNQNKLAGPSVTGLKNTQETSKNNLGRLQSDTNESKTNQFLGQQDKFVSHATSHKINDTELLVKLKGSEDDQNKDTPKKEKSTLVHTTDNFVCLLPNNSCGISKKEKYTLVDRGVCIDEILSEELNKSDQVKRDINYILNRELDQPCGVQITFDIPTRERATEITSSLSKAGIEEIRTPIRRRREMRMTAVNTDPLSFLGLLRISTDTIRRLLSYMHFDYYSYLSMIQFPQLPRPLAVSSNQIAQYVCNICGAVFGRSTELTSHIEAHNLGKARDCCVCRHLLDLRQRCPGVFTCQYCGQCFTRAYCCELHQQSCAKRLGKRHDISESLMLLR